MELFNTKFNELFSLESINYNVKLKSYHICKLYLRYLIKNNIKLTDDKLNKYIQFLINKGLPEEHYNCLNKLVGFKHKSYIENDSKICEWHNYYRHNYLLNNENLIANHPLYLIEMSLFSVNVNMNDDNKITKDKFVSDLLKIKRIYKLD